MGEARWGVPWISQPFGLGRIYPGLRCCGLRCFASVDYGLRPVDYAPAVLLKLIRWGENGGRGRKRLE